MTGPARRQLSGSGEATTRRQREPVGPDVPPRSAGQPAASVLVVERADELGRVGERRVVGADQGLADQARHLTAGQGVLERLEEPVADHALGLGPQDVEGVGVGERGVLGALQGQQPDLGAVAVGDDQIVIAGQRGQGVGRGGDVVLLDLGVGGLAPLEQGVAAQGDDDPHVSSTEVATMAALMVCSRFSAWSKTIEAGDSKTSSVTSRASARASRRSAGRPRSRCRAGRAGSA